MLKQKYNILGLVLIPLIAVCFLGYMVQDIVRSHDEDFNFERSRFLRAVVKSLESEAGQIVRDYTLWPDAMDHVVVSPDEQWTRHYIANYAFDVHDYDTVFVMTPDNKRHMRFDIPESKIASIELEKINHLHRLADDARATKPYSQNLSGAWQVINGELYLVGFSAFTLKDSYQNDVQDRSQNEKFVLFIMKRADQTFFDALSADYGLPKVYVNDDAATGVNFKIQDSHGHLVTTLVMAGKNDIIEDIFKKYGVVVFLMIFMLVAIAAYAMKRSFELKQSHDEVVLQNHHMDDLVRRRTNELEFALDEAEKANNAKTVFLSSMSHEFRTPLNGILGFAQLLHLNKEKNLNKREQQWVEQINNAGELLLKLVNDVLDMSRIEAGKVLLEASYEDPNEIMRQCHDLSHPMAEARSIEITQYVETDRCVCVDSKRLQQVILNLMSNAIKYNREGGKVYYGSREIGNGLVRLYVQDTGYGISKEEQKKIFDPFYRSKSLADTAEGTGVGLSLVARLVEAMGGEIHLESELDKGTIFFVDLVGYEPEKLPK